MDADAVAEFGTRSKNSIRGNCGTNQVRPNKRESNTRAILENNSILCYTGPSNYLPPLPRHHVSEALKAAGQPTSPSHPPQKTAVVASPPKHSPQSGLLVKTQRNTKIAL
jgi:hypothetical protein